MMNTPSVFTSPCTCSSRSGLRTDTMARDTELAAYGVGHDHPRLVTLTDSTRLAASPSHASAVDDKNPQP
jgi:hypothetical protein